MSLKVRSYIIFLSLFSLLFLFGCGTGSEKKAGEEKVKQTKQQDSDEKSEVEVERVAKAPVEEGNISDNKNLYKDDASVITMYLTVSKGNEADGSDHTWQEVNTYSTYDYAEMGIDRYKVEGILEIDETGNGLTEDSYGYGETVPNVSVQVRGQTSSRSEQKNYKIRIKDGKDKYRGQRTLNVNKHPQEPFRFINKLNYDMLAKVPQLIAGRTQFVHLYVKDLTQVSEGEPEYEDYGLYTMIEQVNRTYLKNHGLDENGHLYKVTFFEWDKYEAVMTPVDDPDFDRRAFEEFIEIKGDEDPTKLQDIVDEIHNYSIPIEDIVDEHFDDENIMYWMAFNILNGNYDIGARNCFLYSPLNSEKFYFICWDLDASFKDSYNAYRDHQEGLSWEQGMTKFLGLELINRMMKEDKYRDMLYAAVEDVHKNYINEDIVKKRVDIYKQVTEQYLFQMPDVRYAQLNEPAFYEEMVSKIPHETEENYRIFKENMEKPWPFYVDIPEVDDEGRLSFTWGVSYDHNGEDITYRYVLARDVTFEDVIEQGEGLTVPLITTDMLPPGNYYLRVVATNESGKSMECFDYAMNPGHAKAYGCFAFNIDQNNVITAIE